MGWVCALTRVGVEEACVDDQQHLKQALRNLWVFLLHHPFENRKPKGFKLSSSLIITNHHWSLPAGEFSGSHHQVSVALCTEIS